MLNREMSPTFDDGSGLRVVDAKANGNQRFDWDIVFGGYNKLRVITYSASVPALVRVLNDYNYAEFECVFGSEKVLHGLSDIMAFQKVVTEETRIAIMGLGDVRMVDILQHISDGTAHFRVMRKSVAHSKIYLLSNNADNSTRVIVGSANLSEQAFSGKQSETLVKFDNDENAWELYNCIYDDLRNEASDGIEFPKDNIREARIEISDVPVVSKKNDHHTIVIEPPELSGTSGQAVERIEKMAAVIAPQVNPIAAAASSRGRLNITPETRRQISRIKLVKSVDEASHNYFHIDRERRLAQLSGEQFALDSNLDDVSNDVRLICDYFSNYEGAFEGDVEALQRDYFVLMSWLYFSPFMCDLRGLAANLDKDLIRYPLFAIVFGKSGCGKTSLVDTLMMSMFNRMPSISKSSFTSARLRSIQGSYKRYPVVFDDIGKNAFANHGVDMIKNELLPGVPEYPGFILSMNKDFPSFPDEVVRRSLMIYTQTALPAHNESLRQELSEKISELRKGFTGHLYRRYISEIIDALADDSLPSDWLKLSTSVLSNLIKEFNGSAPHWCRSFMWSDYADSRYDRIKRGLENLLRPSAYVYDERKVEMGWMLRDDKVIVLEPRDMFGRKQFRWDDVPSTLINQEASLGVRTEMYRDKVEEFLGHRIQKPRKSFWHLFRS